MYLYLAFLTVSFVTVATPGPSTFYVLRKSVGNGWGTGLKAVCGILLADTLFLLAGALGLGSVLATAPVLLTVLKLAGATYFAWTAWAIALPYIRKGAQSMVRSFSLMTATPTGPASTSMQSEATAQTGGEASPDGSYGSLHTAFVMHLVNVKALLFFTMLVPQFVDTEKPMPGQVLTLLALHLGMAASVLSAYTAVGAALKRADLGSRLGKILDIISAVVMASLATGILWKI